MFLILFCIQVSIFACFVSIFQGGETLEIDISKCELLKPTTRCQLECDGVSLSDMSEDDAGVVKESSATEVIASSSGYVLTSG